MKLPFGLNVGVKQKKIGGMNISLPFVTTVGFEQGYGKAKPTDFTEQVAHFNSWAYACIQRNAFSIAKVPLKLYNTRAEEEEEIPDHPFLDLMQNVNPFFNKFELWTLTTIFLETTGNAYWWVVKDHLGVPRMIWNLPAHWVKIIPSKTKFIDGYILKPPQYPDPSGIRMKEDEIIHFKYPSPFDLYYGTSPMLASAYGVDLNDNLKTWSINYFMNNAQPSGALTTDNPMNPDEVRRLRDQWNAAYKGSKKAGKMAILWKGLKYQQIGSGLKDMQFEGLHRSIRDEIFAIFGVPASKLGLVEDVNRANAEANDYTYQKETILPRLMLIEEKLNEKLLPMYSEDLVVKFDNPVPEDKEYNLRKMQASLESGVISVDEQRIEEGLEGLGLVESTVPTLGLARQPMQTEEEKETAKDELQANMDADRNPPMVEDDDDDKDKKKPKEEKSMQKDGTRRWQLFDAVTRPQENIFKGVMQKFFDEQMKVVFGNFDKIKSYTKESFEGMDEHILFNFEEETLKLQNMSRPYITQAFESGVGIVGRELGISFDLASPNIVNSVKARVQFFGDEINKTTQKLIIDALKRGDSIETVKNNLMTIQDFNDEVRAQRVAQTEILGSTNDGQYVAYQDAGVNFLKWISARDSKVRPSHQRLEGEVIETGQRFSNGLLRPHDNKAGKPEEVINCRCTTAPQRTRKE